jgi:hypothetical protein
LRFFFWRGKGERAVPESVDEECFYR